MIIQSLIDSELSDAIKDLNFVDRYSGMTKVLNQQQIGQTGGAFKKFPISCCVTEKDCVDNGLYSNLVPDDSKKSVVYWEMVQPMQNRGRTPNYNNFNNKRFVGRARLVVWLNLGALGLEAGDCNGAALTLPSIMNILSLQGKLLSGVYEGNLIKIEPNRIITDLNTIFGKYDYPALLNYHFYPYSYYAIDVDFQLDLCYKNEYQFPIGTSIDCVDYSCANIPPLPTDSLIVHLNPNDIQATDGELLDIFEDSSGNGNDFQTNNPTNRPTFVANAINSVPAVRFNNAYLENTSISLSSNDTFSAWVVCQKEGTPTGILGNVLTLFMNSYSSSSSRFFRISEGFFDPSKYSIDTGVAALNTTLADNTIGTTYLFGIVKNATSIKYYVNNTLVATLTGSHSATMNYCSLGAWNNAFLNGLIAEFTMYDKEQTATEITETIDYFTAKYDL